MQEITVRSAAKGTWNSDLTTLKFSLFHLREWVESANNENSRSIFLDFWQGNTLIAKSAGLVLLEKKKTLGKQLFFFAPPSTFDGLPETMSACLDALARYARKNNYSRIKQFPFDSKTNNAFEAKKYNVSGFTEYILKLDDEYQHFKPGQDLKKKLRLAEKAETEFHVSSNIAHLDLLIDLMHETQKRRMERDHEHYNLFAFKNVTLESLRYLIEQKVAVLYYSLNNGNIHYLTLSLEFGNKAYGLYTGADSFAYQHGLPGFMATKLAQHYLNRGYSYFNIGTNISNKNEDVNISNFKKQIGCVAVDVYCAHSQFLTFPQTIITLAQKAGKKLPHNHITKKMAKAIG